MNKIARAILFGTVAVLQALPVSATYNTTITGHVISIQPLTLGAGYSGAAFAFTLDSGPGYGVYYVSVLN